MIIVIFLLLLAANQSLQLKPSDFCSIENDDQECLHLDFNHKCINFCANNVKTCKSYKQFSMLARKFENPMKDQHKIRKLRSFIDSIEPCKSKNKKWVTTDVCLKRKECLVEKKTPFTLRASLNYALDHSACRCIPGQTICEENFCTKNKEVCNNFKKQNLKRLKIIKNC